MNRRCIAVLGGSFDPVHAGHVALAQHAVSLIGPDELLLVPAGSPWQKQALNADAGHRIAMLDLAFAGFSVPVAIDRQEIERNTASYAIDTVKHLRVRFGGEASIVFIIGADQLQRLDTWKEWQRLFDHVHLCVATRPGNSIDAGELPPEVAREVANRHADAGKVRTTPHGGILIAPGLAADVSSTAIREALKNGQTNGKQLNTWLPAAVLDYIQQQHLYGR